MSYLVANLPPIECYIRKEYLYDFQKGFGEFEPCYWVSVKSIKGKALYIESLLTNYGALYDKLPISAYVWKTDIKENELLPLDFLEIWDAFSYNISIIEKSTLSKLPKGTRLTPNNSPKQFKRINAEEFFKLQFKRLNHLITDPRQQEYFKSKYFTFEGKTENIPQDLIDKIK